MEREGRHLYRCLPQLIIKTKSSTDTHTSAWHTCFNTDALENVEKDEKPYVPRISIGRLLQPVCFSHTQNSCWIIIRMWRKRRKKKKRREKRMAMAAGRVLPTSAPPKISINKLLVCGGGIAPPLLVFTILVLPAQLLPRIEEDLHYYYCRLRGLCRKVRCWPRGAIIVSAIGRCHWKPRPATKKNTR